MATKKEKIEKWQKFSYFGDAFHIFHNEIALSQRGTGRRCEAIACPNKYATIAVALRIRCAPLCRLLSLSLFSISLYFSVYLARYFTFFIAFDFHFDFGLARATLRRGCSTKLATSDNDDADDGVNFLFSVVRFKHDFIIFAMVCRVSLLAIGFVFAQREIQFPICHT